MSRESKAQISCLRKCAVFCLYSCLFMAFGAVDAEPVGLIKEEAILDLSAWDGESVLPLNGPWEFYWERFIEPGQDLPEPDALLEAGRRWNGTVLRDGRQLESFGYASYRIRIKGLAARTSGYEFLLRFANTSYTAAIFADEQRIPLAQASSGDPRSIEQNRINRVIHLPFSAQKNQTLEIIIWVSNKISYDGGVWTIPELAAFGQASSIIQAEGFINLIATGIFLATGFYCYMLWWRRRDDRPALYLSMSALAGVLRIMSTTPWILKFFPDYGHRILYRFEYCSMPFAMGFYLYFLHTLYGRGIGLQLKKYIAFMGAFLCALSLVGPVYYLSGALPLFHLYTLSCVIFCIYLMSGAIRRKEDGMVPTSAGGLLIVAGSAYDMGVAAPGLLGNSIFIAPIAGAIFFILQAQVIAKRAANAYSQAETYAKDIEILNQNLLQEVDRRKELNASLEGKVIERTTEIRSLLQHIPQGILTIGEEGIIGANYSMHLHEIINHLEISNKSFKEVILDPSRLSPNAVDQAWQTILACIGDDVLNFEMNVDNLPIEFIYQGHREVILRCTWNVELDRHNIVRRILVTLMDITAEVESHRKLEAKNKEFQIVRQLIDIGPHKSKQFFASCRELLAENKRLIASRDIDIEDVKILFINTHTLKGSARTLQLTEISDVFHDVESYFADILRHGVAIDIHRLERDQTRIVGAFQQYEAVSRNVLGRAEDDSKILIEREFLEKHLQVLKFISHEGALTSSLKKIIRDNCDSLVKLIFMSLSTVLDDVFQQAHRIAKDLEKAEPSILMKMEDIMISYKQEVAIRNSFIHLLRNSMDHGIELPKQRLAKGKDPRGRITLNVEETNEQIMIRYEDDGAGLAIGHLREKGLEHQLIDSQSGLQEIANLVFHQGVSTSKSVSMISGRGVGMEAVRRFIEAEGGQVQLCLDELIDPEREYYRFHFIIRLPSRSDSLKLSDAAVA